MRWNAPSILLIAAAGCVSPSPARSTADIYAEAVRVAGYAFRCSARDAVGFDAQLEPYIQSLVAELGPEHVADVRSQVDEDLATTSFIRCPTSEDRERARSRIKALLKQIRARHIH